MLKKIKKLIFISKFLFQNKKHKTRLINPSKKILLVEFNNWALLHIAKSLISRFFIKKYKCKLYAYEGYTLLAAKNDSSFFSKILKIVMIKFNLGTYGVYKFFGVSEFVKPKITAEIAREAQKIINIKKINNNSQLYNLKVKNIHFGDLIYDSYLKVFNKPTINVDTQEFKKFFQESVCLILFWYYFLKKNKLNILNILFIHEVYTYGIIPRIAVNFGLEGTKVSHKSLIKFKKKGFYIGQENSYFYKNIFKDITLKEKNKTYKFSKKKLDFLTKKIPFEKSKSKKIKKILVCCHSIKDSPHVFGKFFYNDFHEWMMALSKISQKTNYIWYIKPHPDDTDEIQKEYYLNLVKKFKNVVLLKPNLTKKLKVDLALTCFGTVAYELPYKGIKVINGSKNHPHRYYSFSITPKNRMEFERFILEPNLIKKYKIDRLQILQFYFIKRIYLYTDWIGLNLDKSFKINNKVVKKYYKPTFYNQYYKTMTVQKIKKIDKTILNFYNDRKNIILSNSH